MKKLFFIMMVVCGTIALISLSFFTAGFIKQDVSLIGYSLIPFVFYGLTFLSMALYVKDGDREDFVGAMGMMHFLVGLFALAMIISGFVRDDIHLLNWGFPLLIVSGFVTASILIDK